MTQSEALQPFEQRKVRTVWDDEKEKWYFSIVDVCGVLTDSKDALTARKYWNKLKQRLKEERNETVTNCHQLKLRASDGKLRLTDVADTEQLSVKIKLPYQTNIDKNTMANPTTKQDLLTTIADGYAKLNEQIDKMSAEEIAAPFSFTADPKKCGARWQNDRCLRDLLTHLYEWQVLMEIFVKNIREGHPKDYLPDEYRKNYHEMDRMLVEKHQNTTLEEAKELLVQSHQNMLDLAGSFSEEELFTKGYFKCTYTTTMAAYFLSVTASPYLQAVKLLKMHQKNCKRK